MNEFQDYFYPIKVAIQAEHRALAHAIRAIDQILMQLPKPEQWHEKSEQLNDLLRNLRMRLDQHFHREKADGYLDEAVATLPRLATEVNQIKSQLPILLDELDELLDNSRQGIPTAVAWNRIAEQYRDFALHLLQNEAAENRLLQIGYNEEFDLSP